VRADVVIPTMSAAVSLVTVTVSPGMLPPGGGDADVTAVAFGSAGQRVAGAPVVVTATQGTFAGAGGPHFTDAEGQVTLRLTTSEVSEVRARVYAVESSPVTITLGPLLDPWDDPDLPFRLRDVVWLHANATEWAQTSTISEVTFHPAGTSNVTRICFPHSKAGKWPRSGAGEGNVWIVAEVRGTWYAATWDYIRPGQVCKSANGFTWNSRRDGVGAHTQKPPLESWVPRSGERVGFMVSGFARTTQRTTLERSNIFMTEWP
jgi:hypothetical protein